MMNTQDPQNHPNQSIQKLSTATVLIATWIFTFLLLMVVNCSFEEPVLPQWFVEVNVPLAEETFVLGEEIVNDSTLCIQGADSLLFLKFDGSIDPMELSAYDFSVGEVETRQSFGLGSIQLDSLDILRTGPVSLGTIYPDLQNYIIPGFSVPFTIPDTTLMPPVSVLNTDEFVGLKVNSGQIRIRFTNNLPFPLGPNSSYPQGLQVTLLDSSDTQVIEIWMSQVLSPGEQYETSVPITQGNTWIFAPLKVQYVIPIAQSTTFNLNEDVLNNSGIEIDVSLEDLDLAEAIAQIDAQKFDEQLKFAPDYENRLRTAVIDKGKIRLSFVNHIPLDVSLQFTLPNFLVNGQKPYTDSLHISKYNATETEFLLDGMEISNAANPGAYLDSVEILYSITTHKSSQRIHITSNDSISVDIKIDSLRFSSFSGFIAADTFEIEPFEEDSLVDYKDLPNNFQATDVELNFELCNEVYIQNMLVDLYITGYHQTEGGIITDSATISIENQQITPGHPNDPGFSYLNLSGPDITQFLNILPTRICTFGRVKASGDVSINRKSQVSGNYKFSMPLRFRIEEDTFYEGDVEMIKEEDIDKELREAADENLEEASLRLKLVNGTTLGGSVALYVSADPNPENLYNKSSLNPEREFVKEITLTPAPADPQTGYVINPRENEIFLSLNRDEIRLFKNAPLWVGYKLKLNQTNNVVAIRASDFVKVSGIASVRINVKDGN
ncbi:MAG: hypothetical protein Kow0042_29020 [Calditrichia bacterium]